MTVRWSGTAAAAKLKKFDEALTRLRAALLRLEGLVTTPEVQAAIQDALADIDEFAWAPRGKAFREALQDIAAKSRRRRW